MSVSVEWAELGFNFCVAQVEAPCIEVVKVLAMAKPYNKRPFVAFNGSPFVAHHSRHGAIVVYSSPASHWTYIRSFGHMQFVKIRKVSRVLKSQALFAVHKYRQDRGEYIHYRNGRDCEHFGWDSEEHSSHSLPWLAAVPGQLAGHGRWRLTTKRQLDVDLEEMDFFSMWANLTDHLQLDIPAPQWVTGENPARFEQTGDFSQRLEIETAYLMYRY